jgi:hypothetical protein
VTDRRRPPADQREDVRARSATYARVAANNTTSAVTQ